MRYSLRPLLMILPILPPLESCSRSSDACEVFRAQYHQIGGEFVVQSPSPLTSSDNAAIRRLVQCYSRYPYKVDTKLGFVKKIHKSDNDYFVFNVLVSTDIQLVYGVSRSGRIVSAFRYNQM